MNQVIYLWTTFNLYFANIINLDIDLQILHLFCEYLYNSIVDPASQIVAGYPPAMPQNFGEQLSEQQINDVIEFIVSLSDN